jgi:hypothetical protein
LYNGTTVAEVTPSSAIVTIMAEEGGGGNNNNNDNVWFVYMGGNHKMSLTPSLIAPSIPSVRGHSVIADAWY